MPLTIKLYSNQGADGPFVLEPPRPGRQPHGQLLEFCLPARQENADSLNPIAWRKMNRFDDVFA